MVSYLPVGSEEADKFYAQCHRRRRGVRQRTAVVFIASDPVWAKRSPTPVFRSSVTTSRARSARPSPTA